MIGRAAAGVADGGTLRILPAHAAPLKLPAPELCVVIPTFNERDNVRLLVERLTQTLDGLDWEVIIVDDDSPDGTAAVARALGESDRRVRCICRIARRGLAGACLEGMLASQARYLAVLDADLQHDEALLVPMIERLRRSNLDLVVASRYLDNQTVESLSGTRKRISRWATGLTHHLFGIGLSDPMSGFFMIRRAAFEELAPSLSTQGFKILLDIVVTARGQLRSVEIPYVFGQRLHGQSKLDSKNALDFAALILSKLTGDRVSVRFLLFGLVGLTGVGVHLAVLTIMLTLTALSFVLAQTAATVAATIWNFVLNNAFTYSDQRLTGAPLVYGLIRFQAICGIGAVSNVGVASWIYAADPKWWIAGLGGALMGAGWNYMVTSALVWRQAPRRG
jgi:dolichol-phosphate mannosyltransferase